MSGPTQLIRENCPIATSANDGLMSAAQAAALEGGALPPQLGNGGKYLATDGANASWEMVTNLKWFDVTDPAYGAAGDFDLITGTLVTDDSAAILACIKAATDWAATYAQRFGVVYFPPCAKGKGYGVQAGVALTITQAGSGAGGSLHFDIVGCGADGPIVCATGTGVPTIALTISGLEWFMGSVRNLAFTSSHLDTPLVGIDCSVALKLVASVGKWIVDELHGIGVSSETAVFEFGAGNFEIGTIHNAGCSGGATGTFCHMNQSHVTTLRSIFSYPEFNYQGVDAPGGIFQSLIKIEPSQDTSWGPTSVIIENMHSDVSSQFAVLCQKYTGTIRTAVVQVKNWHIQVNTYGFNMADVDYVEIGPGIWSAGTARQLLYAANYSRIKMTGCKSISFAPDIQGDGSGYIDLIDFLTVGTITEGVPGEVTQIRNGLGQSVGSALTVSSNTIAPIREVHSVGAGLIKTITLPFTGFKGSITLVPSAAFTYDGTGNITPPTGGANTAVVGKPMVATYDGSTWWMSY